MHLPCISIRLEHMPLFAHRPTLLPTCRLATNVLQRHIPSASSSSFCQVQLATMVQALMKCTRLQFQLGVSMACSFFLWTVVFFVKRCDFLAFCTKSHANSRRNHGFLHVNFLVGIRLFWPIKLATKTRLNFFNRSFQLQAPRI